MPDPVICYVITGNITRGVGEVAYLRADATWAPTLAEANPFPNKEDAEARLAEVKVHEEIITEPYVFEAERTGDGIRPLSAREILRAEGPSTRLRRPDDASQRAGAKAS